MGKDYEDVKKSIPGTFFIGATVGTILGAAIATAGIAREQGKSFAEMFEKQPTPIEAAPEPGVGR